MAEIFRFHCEAENEMHGITFRFDFWSILAKIDQNGGISKISEMIKMFLGVFLNFKFKVVNCYGALNFIMVRICLSFIFIYYNVTFHNELDAYIKYILYFFYHICLF